MCASPQMGGQQEAAKGENVGGEREESERRGKEEKRGKEERRKEGGTKVALEW